MSNSSSRHTPEGTAGPLARGAAARCRRRDQLLGFRAPVGAAGSLPALPDRGPRRRRLRQSRSQGLGRARRAGLQRARLWHDRGRRPCHRPDAVAPARHRDLRSAADAPIRGPAGTTPRRRWSRRLKGAVFGVVGLGRIGLAAARRAAGFDMRVVFYDPYLLNGVDLATGYERVDSLAALAAISDVLSVHAPLTDETRGMIGAALLRRGEAEARPRQHRARADRRSRCAHRRAAVRHGRRRRPRRPAEGTGRPGASADPRLARPRAMAGRPSDADAARRLLQPGIADRPPAEIGGGGGHLPARRHG